LEFSNKFAPLDIQALELAATTRAGLAWARAREYPDLVGWDDLAFAANLTAEVVLGRVAATKCPSYTRRLPQPKEQASDVRVFIDADPFDEVVYRALAGRLLPVIEASLGDEVLSYRMLASPPGWTYKHYRYADSMRRTEALGRVLADDFGGLGIMDVRNYYPSVTVAILSNVLTTLGCNPRDVAQMCEWLRGWQEVWSVPGIPVGPEGSGCLGNAVLVPVDRALRRAGVNFQRYTDDLRFFLQGPEQWPMARDLVRENLATLGLESHPYKTKHVETRGCAVKELSDPALHELGDLLREDRTQGVARARDLFEEELERTWPSAKRVKFCLKVFSGNGVMAGVEALDRNRGLFRLGYRVWGDYLGQLHRSRLVTADWLVEAAANCKPGSDDAAQFHLLRAAAKAHVGKALGEQARTLANDGDGVPVAASRAWAVEVWRHSDAWTTAAAVDGALEQGPLALRRAWTLALRRKEGKRVKKGLAKIRAAIPECRPTTTWIENGAPEAA
jgi:hypothetical protein